mmetsp:Transcript_13924/g.32482  ORF Transcript_13924/g.32482 Transcript_13924/m.32482 type:complete len:318 (-) Transcript_13924:710-1663(-)
MGSVNAVVIVRIGVGAAVPGGHAKVAKDGSYQTDGSSFRSIALRPGWLGRLLPGFRGVILPGVSRVGCREPRCFVASSLAVFIFFPASPGRQVLDGCKVACAVDVVRAGVAIAPPASDRYGSSGKGGPTGRGKGKMGLASQIVAIGCYRRHLLRLGSLLLRVLRLVLEVSLVNVLKGIAGDFVDPSKDADASIGVGSVLIVKQIRSVAREVSIRRLDGRYGAGRAGGVPAAVRRRKDIRSVPGRVQRVSPLGQWHGSGDRRVAPHPGKGLVVVVNVVGVGVGVVAKTAVGGIVAVGYTAESVAVQVSIQGRARVHEL